MKGRLLNEKNVLSIISQRAGIDLPTFCYHSELYIRRLPYVVIEITEKDICICSRDTRDEW